MAELDLTAIAATSIATPAAGVLAVYADSTTKALASKNDAGVITNYVGGLKNQAVASVTGYASDTYLAGSSVALASAFPLVGTQFYCIFDVTKSAAGIAAPIIVLRYGTAGAVGDAAICTFTFNAQTGVADNGTFEIYATFRTIGTGTSAVVQAFSVLKHNLAATGLGSVNPAGFQQVIVTSSGFNSAVASSILGVSVNGGASASWTTTLVQSNLLF